MVERGIIHSLGFELRSKIRNFLNLQRLSLDLGMPPLKKVKTDKTASKDAKDALYARCLLEGPNKRFTTNDLLDLGVIRRNDHDLLMECTQSLLKEGLFQASDSALGATFKVVKKEDAAR